jgi:tetratricopeptide (TPR) repeat protein
MRRGRLIFAAAVALVAASAALLGGALAGEPSAQPAPSPAQRGANPAGQLLQGFSPGDTREQVARLEQRVRENPRDAEGLSLLGLGYQQRARETGDPSFYARSEEALRSALALAPRDALAVTGLAALAASRHSFEEARRLAERARRLAPGLAAVDGILGDALVELGRYDEAFEAFDRMAARKPTLAAYARVAYARELLGRRAAAIAAMKLAVGAGAGQGENEAWALVELGHLHFNSGRLRPAERAYRGALARFPGYHRAQAGLARIEAARGRLDAAVGLYRRALEAVPLPEYAAALGETLEAAGRMDEAQEAYAVVDATQRLLEANGVRTDLETALIDLDRGVRLPDALARAREAYEERRSIEAEDVLAWALYKNGRCEEARAHSVRALRLGTLSALKLFHRGLIERCLGRGEESEAFLRRALDVNPYFSLRYAPVAQEALR